MAKRLTRQEINEINKLIEKGFSLNKIRDATGKSKTTVYYHFRRFKGPTVKPITLKSHDEELIGEFMGLFAGDGCLYKTKNYIYRAYLYFNIIEKAFVDELISEVLIKLFGKKPMVFRKENRLNLCYYSKNIHEFVKEYLIWDKSSRKTYSVRLAKEKHTFEFMVGFLRGSVDSDGYFSKNRISFATVSEGLMKNISNYLSELNILHSVRLYKEKRENRKDIYHITISKKDHKRFVSLINPRNK